MCENYERQRTISVKMSIRRFFKPKNGLPDPKGSLSASLPLQAIALANKEVQNVVNEKAVNVRYRSPSTIKE